MEYGEQMEIIKHELTYDELLDMLHDNNLLENMREIGKLKWVEYFEINIGEPANSLFVFNHKSRWGYRLPWTKLDKALVKSMLYKREWELCSIETNDKYSLVTICVWKREQ